MKNAIGLLLALFSATLGDSVTARRTGIVANCMGLRYGGTSGLVPVCRVPRSPAPLVDGRIDPGEWDGADTLSSQRGGMLRLQHDGRHLFAAITAPTVGFPSICLFHRDTILVLHASAALGKVSYTRSEDAWLAMDSAFVYGMRNPDTTQQGRSERAEYLARHGWVASTFRMGGMRVYEFQIAADLVNGDARMAAGYFGAGAGTEGNPVFWPNLPGPPGEGCGDVRLLSGRVPKRLRFNLDRFAGLALE